MIVAVAGTRRARSGRAALPRVLGFGIRVQQWSLVSEENGNLTRKLGGITLRGFERECEPVIKL